MNLLYKHLEVITKLTILLEGILIFSRLLHLISNNIYQVLSKVNIITNKDIQQIREDNTVDEGDKSKIIDLDKNVNLKNIENLDNINDILIYSLYSLFPARRLK